MQLLVSVRNAAEASAALFGGADIVDAKEPLNGPLGAVSAQALYAIATAVGNAVPISAAIGDMDSDVAGRASAARRTGAAFVKVGFAGMRGRHHLADDVQSLAQAVQPSALILVAYADFYRADAPRLEELLHLADRVDAAGVLLDTWNKHGAGLTSLISARALASFVGEARRAGRLAALAGRLTADDIELALESGADVIGFRGAACDGGRSGVVTAERVRALRLRLDQLDPAPHAPVARLA